MQDSSQFSAAFHRILGGYVVAFGKTRMDLASQNDSNLQNRRFEAYSEFWNLKEQLAKWCPPMAAVLSYKNIKN
jgi:hypothetical protein